MLLSERVRVFATFLKYAQPTSQTHCRARVARPVFMKFAPLANTSCCSGALDGRTPPEIESGGVFRMHIVPVNRGCPRASFVTDHLAFMLFAAVRLA